MDKKYFLSFVEEGIFAPGYGNWAGGRMEIYTDESPYAIDEIRFFTPRTAEWIHFREKYDFEEEINEETLKEVVDIINTKYNDLYVPLGESDDGEKEDPQVFAEGQQRGPLPSWQDMLDSVIW